MGERPGGQREPNMFARRRTRPWRTILALVAAGSSVAAAAVAIRGRVAARARSRPRHETWECACGTRYRYAGAGRHRIYWPEHAPEDDPLMAPECLECGRPLPTDRPPSSRTAQSLSNGGGVSPGSRPVDRGE